MIDIKKDKFVILEIVPTALDPAKGDIAQLSALLINEGRIVDRFDYRLNKDKVKVPEILRMLDYDNDAFKYEKTTKNIMKKFGKFMDNLPLLIIENEYTRNYLRNVDNEKESVFKYLDLEVSDDVFDRLIKKYDLEPSNYFVDLLYEALMRK